MSVICAIPKNGVIYFASDNQVTTGGFGCEITETELLKIQVIGDFVIGMAGSVNTIELVYSIFNELKGKKLNKTLLIKEFLPRYIKRAKELGFIKESKSFVSFSDFPQILIGCGSKLYYMEHELIYRLTEPQSIGSGAYYLINSINQTMEEKDINKNMVAAIQKYASLNIYVNTNVTLVNTRDLKVEVIRNDNSL